MADEKCLVKQAEDMEGRVDPADLVVGPGHGDYQFKTYPQQIYSGKPTVGAAGSEGKRG